MGLLDMDPQQYGITQGLLGMGSALLTPVARGGGFGAVGPALMSAQTNAMNLAELQQQAKARQEQSALMKAYRDAQIAQLEAETKAKKDKTDFLTELATRMGGAQIPQGFDMLGPGAKSQVFQPQYTQQDLLRAASLGIPLDTFKTIAESKDWGAPQVARTVKVAGPGGVPMVQQLDAQGRPVGQPMPEAYERKLEDFGGTKQAYDPYTGGLVGGAFKKTQSPDSAASNALGWANYGLSKDRLAFEKSGGNEKPPSGYRFKPDGSLEAIAGGPADPKSGKVSDAERLTAGYTSRMDQAEQIISRLPGGAAKPGVLESAARGMPGVGEVVANNLRDPDRQLYRQAQEDWVRAKLRKESGAVIGKEEMDQEIRTYFPQLGDSPQVIAQKAQARRVAAEAMRTASGPAAYSSAVPQTGIGSQSVTGVVGVPADISAILGKYK